MQNDANPPENLSDNPPHHPAEADRLAALARYDVLDTAPEPAFNRIVTLVAKVLDVPIATISLVDAARQWLKAKHGTSLQETPRCDAFCDHAIRISGVTVVPDATLDVRFADNPYVIGDPGIRFYAAAPLITPDGLVLGALCAMDRVPRQISPTHQAVLAEFAAIVVHELEVRAALGTLYDEIDRKRRVRRTLEGEQARLAALLDATGSAALITDSHGTLTGFNDAAARLFGLRPGTAIGLPVGRLLAVELGDEAASEGIGTRMDGHAFPIEVVRAGWTDAEGNAAQGTVVRDITRRRALDAHQKRETKQVLTRIARSVAHDLNNLLQPVIGLTDLELDCLDSANPASPADTRENLQTIAACGRQIQGAVIGKILGFAWEGGAPPTPLALAGALRRILDSLRQGLPPKTHWTETIADLATTQVLLHEADLAEVVSSLVENAVEAMDGVGTLSIGATIVHLDDAAEPICAITVTDSGRGMSPADTARAFEPFFSTKPIGEGDGLGLTAALSISRRWGGSITARSAPGRGTTLTLTLPLIPGGPIVVEH